MSPALKNVDIAQKQLDAYNTQDLDEYVSYFTEDVVVAPFHGAPTEIGRDAIHARYAKAFQTFPENKAVLKNRIVVGDTVVDHELVIRKPGGEQFEVIAIYTFRDGLIARVNFAK
jgi:uncharacterized protein (TIGR02246 family)